MTKALKHEKILNLTTYERMKIKSTLKWNMKHIFDQLMDEDVEKQALLYIASLTFTHCYTGKFVHIHGTGYKL